MSKWKNAWAKAKDASDSLVSTATSSASKAKGYIEKNKDGWIESGTKYSKKAKVVATGFYEEGSQKLKEQVSGGYAHIRYSKANLKEIENDIEAQGAYYREIIQKRRVLDTAFIGGESAASLLIALDVPDTIESAYQAAFPLMSQETDFLEKIQSLNSEEEILGLLSAVKGKMFEQEYVGYLNDGALPNGYYATLADSPNQASWDIAIYGPNDQITEVLQAKATDSISYVKQAIDANPSIDVVTTEEVYSHLVMSGVANDIINGGVSSVELSDQLEAAADNSDIEFDFMPPVLTLAFIAFTSYRGESLTLYQKAQMTGDRSAKAYLSYLAGGGIAALTNVWWLGVLGSVASRYIADEGARKNELMESLYKTKRNNWKIIEKVKGY